MRIRPDDATIIAALVMRDGEVCYICGQGRVVEDPWEREHFKPLVAGGSNDLSNLQLAHRSCNRRKATKAVTRT